MTVNAGIWIDHHKAVVVLLEDGVERVETILSNSATGRKGETSDANSYTRNDFVAEDKLERKAMIHFEKHYDEVIEHLHDADSIFIMGPGEAKGEFVKRIDGTSLKGRVSSVEVADKMTERQVAAHVRNVFGNTQKATK